MTLDELKQFLVQRGVNFTERPIQYGVQLRCRTGEVFSWYERRGNLVVGGQVTELGQAVKAWAESGFVPKTTESGSPNAADGGRPLGPNKDIFVVYGHDGEALRDLQLLLHRMKLNPIVLANLTPDGDTIIEKLERYLGAHSNVGFACVLLTPDDEGYPAGNPDARQYRARQNVILELGMVLARLSRKRVAILYKESVEQPSDISGLIYIPFKERIDEAKSSLFSYLEAAGYAPDRAALT